MASTPASQRMEDLEAHVECHLPRCSPFVGFLPHAPRRRVRTDQLDQLLLRRSKTSLGPAGDHHSVLGLESDWTASGAPDIRKHPYAGYQRHAPPSPLLRFREPDSGSSCPSGCAARALPEILELAPLDACPPARSPGRFPKELWLAILSDIVEVAALPRLSRIAKWFSEAVQERELWRDREVRINPGSLEALAPKLLTWLPVWHHASKVVVPRSQQLLGEIARHAPHLRVEVAWRFHAQKRGADVDIVRSGLAVRRIGTQELVVLGDAPLPTSSKSGEPYLEVVLDERGEDIGDGINDFGLGVTACDPDELNELELGAAAAGVPRSWVVDFTQASVSLSVNDLEAARGSGSLSSRELKRGDRVGLRVTSDGSMEVFLNGLPRERLVPGSHSRVPTDSRLFAVLDLWGRSVQLSRTSNDAPSF